MADPQNIEVMQDPKGPPPANANGVEAEHQGDDDAPDPKLLKSEIDKLKKQLGTVLNEKKRETEAKRALSEKLKGWADLEEETGLNVEQAREMAKARNGDEGFELGNVHEGSRQVFLLRRINGLASASPRPMHGIRISDWISAGDAPSLAIMEAND